MKYDASRHQYEAFQARLTSHRSGRLLYTSDTYSSRDEAAAEIFDHVKTAQQVTTWRAHKQADGTWFAAADMQVSYRPVKSA